MGSLAREALLLVESLGEELGESLAVLPEACLSLSRFAHKKSAISPTMLIKKIVLGLCLGVGITAGYAICMYVFGINLIYSAILVAAFGLFAVWLVTRFYRKKATSQEQVEDGMKD
jgi:hypothetical protein